MVRIFIPVGMSVFFMGLAWLVTHNWIIDLLVAFFVMIFAVFVLGLTYASRLNNVGSGLRLGGFTEPKTAPVRK